MRPTATLPIAAAPIAVAMACLAAAPTRAAEVLIGNEVAPSDRVSLDRIDHSGWDALLRRYVDPDGLVDYQAWHGSSQAIASLDRYLATLSAGDADGASSNAARVAFWINAYNAVTIKGILREYPTTSIRNHTAALWGYNVWKNLKLRVDGQRVSLDHIEHEILRPLGEPRIHFAIVCASIGCPRLLNEAYSAERLDTQLETNARHFFRQHQNFQADAAAKTIQLSSILKWFGEDFGADQSAVLERIGPWLPSDTARALAAGPGTRVRYLKYDWDLNEQKK